MKSFPKSFASLPTVLLLLIPIGIAAMPLRPVFAPFVATHAETRGHPPSLVDDPRVTQSELPPPQPLPPPPSPDLAPPPPGPRPLPEDPFSTTTEPPTPATGISDYSAGSTFLPSHRHPHPSALLPPRPTPASPACSRHRRRLLPEHRPTPTPISAAATPSTTTTPSLTPATHPPPTAFSPPPRLSLIPSLHPPRPLFLPRLCQPPRFPQAAISSQSATQQPSPTTRTMTATPDNLGQAPPLPVPPEPTFLSTREQASLILITIFVCCLIVSAGLRAHIPLLLRTSLRPAILLPLLLMLAYASFEVWIGFQLGWWSPILAKDTVTWTVASGAVLLYKGILHANHEPRFFYKTASATIAPTVFLTFFMNLTTLGLLAELALQLLLIPVTMLSTFAHASSDKTHHAVGKLCDGLLSLVGLSWFIYTVIHVQGIWHQLDVHLVAQKLFLPMWLTLELLPFIYVLSVYVAYQRPLGIIESQTQVFRVRCRAIVAIILTLGLKVRDVTQLQHFWIKKLVDAKTLAAARSAVRQFQGSLRDAERAIAEENDRLRRYAGIDAVDSEGRRLDRREFKETIKALQWLATCHTGHYRKRNRYDRNLLHLLGDSFTTWGIPKETGIKMKVAKGGQRWFAYRRTVSDWYFAIGAAGPPPDQWEYDGPDPPSGFPGEDRRWGSRSFEDTANRNWG